MNAIAGRIEHPSGKGRRDENFPVGSWLIRADLRPHVHAFYRFARNADDVADASDLQPAAKLQRLDRMAEVLDGGAGSDAPAAQAMRASLAETGVESTHCHELLQAFRQDAVKLRYADWGELMAYCRLSAAPVGRYLLDLHSESRETWAASDALCAALQVINHVQDCAKDYKTLDRVYLPHDLMAEAGIGVTDLALGSASPGLRRVLDQVLDLTAPLVERSRGLPRLVQSPGLRRETSIIVVLAERLLALLRARDPLARDAKLGPVQVAGAIVVGLLRDAMGRAAMNRVMPIAEDGNGGWDAASEALVTERVRQSGTSFYWGMRLLERNRRLAMYAIYAFCREVDDIADGDLPPETKRAELARWRSEIDALYDGRPNWELTRALLGPVAEFDLWRDDFIAVIAGCEMDADGLMLRPSKADLDLYCDRVACAVGRLSVKAFGEPSDKGIAVADSLGRALQLTNILRDVGEDAAMGRLYLPDEALSAHGIEGRDLKLIIAHPALPDVCRDIAKQARTYFAEAGTAIVLCARKPMRPAAMMRATYLAVLDRCEVAGFAVGAPVPKVPKPLKLWLLLRYGLI